MSTLRLVIREIAYRKLNVLLALIAIAAAAALFVGTQTLSLAMKRETIRLMRDMGFNLLILPDGTELADFWRDDYARREMPEQYVRKLADSHILSVRHLVAQLQKKIQWRGRTVLLTGVLPEVPMTHRGKKSPMDMPVPRGEAYMGYQLARSLGIEPGDRITLDAVASRTFTVGRCLEPTGNEDEIRIYVHLHDAQGLLGKPGRINVIEALHCLCEGVRREQQLAHVTADVQSVLPGTQVRLVRNIALARQKTRAMVDRYAAVILPVVMIVCAAWVGLLALANVRERRSEIGILRAQGVGSGKVAALFLVKAALLGLAGGALGFALGSWLAVHFGPRLFPVTARNIRPAYPLLLWSVAAAPLVCMLASYVPAMLAVAQDPALVLREE